MKWDAEGKPKKPTIIGIGAQKAGTTWLSQMLGQHPGVWAPPLKEIQYFNYLHNPEHRDWLPWHFRRGKANIEKRYATRGEEMPGVVSQYLSRITRDPMFTRHWYKQVFAPAPEGTQPMDVTPEYSTLPEDGVAEVAKFLPEARFIYIIRHPVDRAISQMKMNITRAGRKPASLEDWLREIEDPVLADRGDYQSYLPRWTAHFGPDRLLVLPFGMIEKAPLEFMRRIEAFLGLPEFSYQGLRSKVFAAKTGLSVPDAARARLRAQFEPQFAFLEETFGQDFMARIR
ncbi:sulfotransferase family protein [Paracoccus aminophilus]|uniref:Sulfotransferase n=1 Tax=Paracoccus aminophilus JCM 7686 TaxID=1367847 RepID=S5XW79_PARAH|nr:sulfotransferase [Paracoccus aminophilus]AGT07640.1 hypothetical protein JCM7686_0531 [Paracoccus aminophilus JCM 7686]